MRDVANVSMLEESLAQMVPSAKERLKGIGNAFAAGVMDDILHF